MATTVAGIFEDRATAERAINDLQAAGFRRDDIGIVMQDKTEAAGLAEDTGAHVAADATTGAVTGGVVGGVGAAILGLGSLVIPGVGPFLAGGILAAALGGALTGGIIGALVGLGFSEDEAGYYDEEIRGGRTLVTVRTDEARAAEARRVLNSAGARFYQGTTAGAMAGTAAGTSGGFGTHRSWDEAMPSYRERWTARYGTTGGRWEDWEPSYRYGHEMSADTRYRGRDWNEVEPDLRSNYRSWAQSRGYRHDDDSAWDNFKEGVRDTWDNARGRGDGDVDFRESHRDSRV
jgi:hypothetical protein